MENIRASELYENLETWMTNLPPKLKSLPINFLAIPGSHDSMTSAINRKSPLAPDAESFLQKMQFLGPLLKLIMSRWARTQALNMKQQLYNGLRYFDLRVATKKRTTNFYFVHGQYSTDVIGMFEELKQFLTTHPMEVVVLDFQHFYAFNQADHESLIGLIKSTFGNLLMPYSSDMQHVTLEFMTLKCRHQLIVVYRASITNMGQPLLWRDTSFPTPWPQTVDELELFDKLNRGISSRSFTTSFVSQCVLTPTNWFVTKHLFSTLKKQCAEPVHKDVIEWIRKQKVGMGGVNIIIGDFINLKDSEFVREVIGLNAKFLHNSLLSASDLTPVDTS